MANQTNPQLELAHQYVRFTRKNVFLTGKAGTGKTTFLHEIKKDSAKRSVVVAPTGVAAINAGGVTIHSFFQLPFGPNVPGAAQGPDRQRKFSGEKIRLLKSLDLLIIDEISMVRADLLDAVDEVLRRFKDPFRPFGGVQLLMIGDLHQLPPVVKEEEWLLLREHYPTAYFFGSKALRETSPVQIELTHIYRQSDNTFIQLLNRVRDNRIDQHVLEKLNSRFVPNFSPGDEDGFITLSSHNASATEINTRRLAALKTEPQVFKATIEGDFPQFSYPTDEVLELKIGAQVMFVKNDASRDKLFYNGKIGKITRFDGDEIWVKCPSDLVEIPVLRVEWQNLKYKLNEATKEVDEEAIGKFVQFPLKLAWAITIHKSQGLTFEKAIIDANAAFAHGQVYVALSRCKTFEGMVLSSKIGNSAIRTDAVVKNYSEEASRNPPNEADLQNSKAEFQRQLLTELFTFSEVKKMFERARRVFSENENALQPGILKQLQEANWKADELLFAVSEKFQPQLQAYFQQAPLPEENPDLRERAKRASSYFSEKLKTEGLAELQKIKPETDNKEVKKRADEAMENLLREVFVKIQCFDWVVRDGFSTNAYLREKANAALDFQMKKPTAPPPALKSPILLETGQTSSAEIPHPELVERLRAWRFEFSVELQVEPFQVLHNKVLYLIAAALPQDLFQLEMVKGMGKAKVGQFGSAIVEIVQGYCLEMGISPGAVSLFEGRGLSEKMEIPPPEKPKPAKIDTKRLSFDLFKSGKTVEEIAAERGFVASTIEGHLLHFIGTGELRIEEVLPPRKVAEISFFFRENPGQGVGPAREFFGEQFTYGELRMVFESLRVG